MATSASDARSAALAAAAIGAGFTVAGFVGGFIISRKSAGEAAALKVRVAEQAKAAQVTQEMLEARVAELKQMLDGHGGDTTQVASSAGRIADLEAELDYFKARNDRSPEDGQSRRPVRVYMDGCFDMMHFGHANALRQAKLLGDVLVAGIHCDREITENKGRPVMRFIERYEMLKGTKWVDEIIGDPYAKNEKGEPAPWGAPYSPHPEWLDRLFTEFSIDFLVHGDDPTINAAGEDAYAAPKKAGKFKMIKRTEGVSTTDIVGRMLLATRDHHVVGTPVIAAATAKQMAQGRVEFLPTTHRIMQFSKGVPAKKDDVVVMVTGAFDLFHVGHIKALEAARALVPKDKNCYLLVGIHDDPTVNERHGANFPIMNVHERSLSVLSCKHVDEVIIGAPYVITEDLIKTMNVQIVAAGTVSEVDAMRVDKDYEVPRKMDILRTFKSPLDMTSNVVMERVLKDRGVFLKKFEKKSKREASYYQEKQVLQET